MIYETNRGRRGEEREKSKNRKKENMDRGQVILLAKRDKGCARRKKRKKKRQ